MAYVAFILRHLESGNHLRIFRETDKTEWFFSFLLFLYVADLCKREVAGRQGKVYPSFVKLKKKAFAPTLFFTRASAMNNFLAGNPFSRNTHLSTNF